MSLVNLSKAGDLEVEEEEVALEERSFAVLKEWSTSEISSLLSASLGPSSLFLFLTPVALWDWRVEEEEATEEEEGGSVLIDEGASSEISSLLSVSTLFLLMPLLALIETADRPVEEEDTSLLMPRFPFFPLIVAEEEEERKCSDVI